MKYNLNWKQTLGVVAVGLAASEGARRLANTQKTDKSHQIAMLAGGAVLYTAGVVIGTNKEYWPGSKNISGSCNHCGSENFGADGSCNQCGSMATSGSCNECGMHDCVC